jgi:hypothetical protein
MRPPNDDPEKRAREQAANAATVRELLSGVRARRVQVSVACREEATPYRARGIWASYEHDYPATQSVALLDDNEWEALQRAPKWESGVRVSENRFALSFEGRPVAYFDARMAMLSDAVLGGRVLVPHVHSGWWIPCSVEASDGR